MSLGSTSNFFLGAASATGGGTAYEIQRSLRFNSADSAYLNRTPSSAGDRRKWTWSGWVKRSSLGARQQIFGAVTSGSIFGSLEFNSIDSLTFYENTLGSISIVFTTDRIFKDTSAWYHIVLALDTTQTTESDRVKLYVNGAQETSFSAGPNVAADGEGLTNSITGHNIGSWTPASSGLDLGAYLAETHFIDGQALAASDFGEYDTNNLWQPKAYTGTYNPQVNNSQDWSSAPFNSGNTSDPSYPATNAFNGSIGTTYTDGWLPANGNTITWTSDGNFSSATSVQIYYIATGGGALTVNGSAVTTTNDSTVRSVIVDVTGTGFSGFTNNWINSPNGPMSVLAVEVDGVRLVDTTVSSATSNSFNLDFSDNSSVAALGTDSSGNSNTWTVNNISVSPGAGNDSLIDSPTNYTADSGNNGGNYATLNPLITKSTTTISNGNLDVTSSGQTNAVSSIVPSSGKWYFEITLGTIVTNSFIGLYGTNPLNSSYLVYGINGYGFLNTGWGSATSTVTGTGVAGDVIGLAFDADAKTLEYYKNGSSIGTISGWTYVANWSIGFSANTTISTRWVFNFGQRPFAYTPPTNYLSLCSTNLADPPIPEGSQEMDIQLWTGTGSGGGSDQTITGYNFAPQFVWIKNRSASEHHALFDQIRGATKVLYSSLSSAEATQTNGLKSFTSDGFELGIDGKVNGNGSAIVGWAWDSATSTSSNTDGDITSQVRVNASAGFSIVTWTGNGSTATIGHGLSDQPSLILVKNRDDGVDWRVYHNGGDLITTSGGAYSPFYFWRLNSDAAKDGSAVNGFTNTRANSTVFSYAANVNVNNQDQVAYCWAAVAGYSAFGNYTGNGSTDGPFVNTGFRPRFLMVRSASSPRRWGMFDTERFTSNGPQMPTIYANVADAETTTAENYGDFLSNGFKVRYTNGNWNGNGESYIYAAFAEHPFKTARAR